MLDKLRNVSPTCKGYNCTTKVETTRTYSNCIKKNCANIDIIICHK